jgi:hypothetical protein
MKYDMSAAHANAQIRLYGVCGLDAFRLDYSPEKQLKTSQTLQMDFDQSSMN